MTSICTTLGGTAQRQALSLVDECIEVADGPLIYTGVSPLCDVARIMVAKNEPVIIFDLQ